MSEKAQSTKSGIYHQLGLFWHSNLLLLLIASYGVFVRAVSYIGNRSLWVDEAALAISLVTRSFSGLLQPLQHHQVAPIGFVFIERFFVELFGTSEYALRVWPFIAGVVSIFLFWLVARKILNRSVLPIALLFFCCSQYLIYFSSEVKQYSSDVFWCLVVVNFAVYAVSQKRGVLFMTLFAAAGGLAVWCSHPVLFVLGGVGLGILCNFVFTKNFKQILIYVPVFAVWAVSFLLNYFLILSRYEKTEGLLDFWENLYGFMPLVPKSVDDLIWFPKAFENLLYNPLGFKFAIPYAIIIIVGCIWLYKSNRAFLVIFLGTIGLGFLGSGFRMLPFSLRLILFTVPLFLIVLSSGIEVVRQRLIPTNKLIFILIVFVLLFHPIAQSIGCLVKPITREETKPLLTVLQEKAQSADTIYTFGAKKAVNYYSQIGFFRTDAEVIHSGINLKKLSSSEGFSNIKKGARVWFLVTHTNPNQIMVTECYFDSIADRLQQYKADGAWLYLYQF